MKLDNDIEIAWAAGFIEGEGSFSIIHRHEGKNHYARVQAHQVEREPLDRLVSIFGGKVYLRDRKSKTFSDGYKRQDIHVWDVYGEAGRVCMDKIYPHLSERRKAQIDATR